MTWKRITKKNRPTFPCVVAKREAYMPAGWHYYIAYGESDVRKDYTHWTPWTWPGGTA